MASDGGEGPAPLTPAEAIACAETHALPTSGPVCDLCGTPDNLYQRDDSGVITYRCGLHLLTSKLTVMQYLERNP